MQKPTTEKRRFGIHPNLLHDIIHKQAGTLQKAILEAVMNSVDAGATRIDVSLDSNGVVIADDGKGFSSRKEIEEFFETFGTPHVEGDATYGRFRMGRGQCFSFGINHWETKRFRMRVDVKKDGLDYDLEESAESAPDAQRSMFDAGNDAFYDGCRIRIDLYNKLLPSELSEVERELRAWVAWVSVPIHLNGVLTSEDPAKAKWTSETDDAYFKLTANRSVLTVYNQGVHVMNAPASRYGIGGFVVSKHRLDVNFARNDVQNTCPVFKRIKAHLAKHSAEGSKTTRKLTETQKTHLARQIVSCDIDWQTASKISLITDVDGKSISLDGLRSRFYQTHEMISAPRGDRTAIKVGQMHMAIPIAQETLDRFDVKDVQSLIAVLLRFAKRSAKQHQNWYARYLADCLEKAVPKTLEDYRHLVNATYSAVAPKDLSPGRRKLLSTASKASSVISDALSKPYRRVHAGSSEVALAWTDGVRDIWIDQNTIPMMSLGYQGCARFAALMLHEYMHDGPDTETHEHDAEFYENFHDAAVHSDVIGKAATAMMRHMASMARSEGAKPTDRVLLFEDNEETLVRAGAKGSEPTGSDEAEQDDQDPSVLKAA